jgi:hypothetical protein
MFAITFVRIVCDYFGFGSTASVLSYAPRENTGDSMKLDVYSVAFEEANSELLDITKRFEQLRRRKQYLETLIAAIGSLLGVAAAPNKPLPEAVQAPAPSEPQAPSEPVSYTFNQVPVPLPDESNGDPFQRRVRNALKLNQGLQTAV